MRHHWATDPGIDFLNHGSFGACPTRVLEQQTRLREQLELNPVRFMLDLPDRLSELRERVGRFMGAVPRDIVFVSNATAGVNAVLRSLDLRTDDELLTTDHTYAACKNALDFVAARCGARVVVAPVPFPIQHSEQVLDSLLRHASPRTRLALVDHVTSITGLVFDVATIVSALKERGIETLVDGAHAPGMLELDLTSLGAAYYAANFHKWVCAPKGAGMLWVRRDLQEGVFPPVISHGYGAPVDERFVAMFDWTGTVDPTPWLCVPEALEVMQEIGGSWQRIRQTNRELALKARDILCRSLEIPKPAPDEMLGSLVSVPLPAAPRASEKGPEPLYLELVDKGFEVLVLPWTKSPARVLRVSAQLYNTPAQYEALAELLPGLLQAERHEALARQ